MKYLEDTIAAISTAIGEAGISVIRISGKDAIKIADKVFRGKRKLEEVKTHTAHYGKIVDASGRVVDYVVATVFRAPHSYTGEDTVEISCHGGIFVTRKVLETILEAGARLAQPGEFTKRAFLNGRIDLSQAEAIADLIRSATELAYQSSLSQLEGSISNKIKKMRDDLINLCSLVELELDFADEDLEFVDKPELAKKIKDAISEIDELIETFKFGKIYREGIKVVIAGKPNAGKSSLLNALLNENRAIVSDIPGTTRDIIEESLNIEGVLFRVIDTAGLRETYDIIEQEGVRRAEEQMKKSDMILLVIDSTDEIDEDDIKLYNRVLDLAMNESKRCIVVFNKVDLLNGKQIQNEKVLGDFPVVYVSALTGQGLDKLKKLMVEQSFLGTNRTDASVVVTNVRHRDALVKAKQSLQYALKSLEEGMSGDLVAVDLRAGLNHLGEIIGEVTTDDILNNIFSKFCIGK
ncbi:tRNA uridine-5-carboxymethylaminomethyl(34) synthesis GTPase MnmE [Candidatus Chrysopegis kryptomonas]|uniref:tRNA modification GTPase MnmE n=1 Tax=Candidatus Chryseopegocella kryptomonas TaxID=1633643 RepID=A0A0N7MWG6_9BACT|nr:tRNA uridine-5-carboxymethylaminomethyl(34) synthesis GTPase MnmE [Candidatus Chrysopegis kryptomonas]CUS98587.1 tRNA modification GTPase [Candidatus Chrysopegis kryptomonas]